MGKALVDYLSGAIKAGKPAMRRWCMAAIRIYSLIRIMKASSVFMFR